MGDSSIGSCYESVTGPKFLHLGILQTPRALGLKMGHSTHPTPKLAWFPDMFQSSLSRTAQWASSKVWSCLSA